MKTLKIIEFGNPILRKTSKHLSSAEIKSNEIQTLIKNMRHTLITKKLGIAIAAPQVSENIALAVVAVRPTKHRPKVKEYDLVIINPKYTGISDQKEMWEGCISAGASGLFAKTPRFKKITVNYLDENGEQQNKTFTGLKAQIIQHETDHLNGILFVDKVQNTKTYMSMSEYRKRITPSK